MIGLDLPGHVIIHLHSSSLHTHLFWLWKRVWKSGMAICFTTACVGVCASGVNVRSIDSDLFSLKWKGEKKRKKNAMVSPHCASLKPTHTTTHICTCTHSFVPQAGVLCGRHGNPPLSPPLISSSTLHDSLQSVNLELSPHDAIPGTVTGGGIKQQERGEVGAGGRVGVVG